MKKFILLFLLVVSATFSSAQKGALVRMTVSDLRSLSPQAFAQFVKENPKFIFVTPGKETVYPSSVLNMYWTDIKGYDLDMQLPEKNFPASYPENERMIRQALEKLSLDLKRFEAQTNRFISNLQSEVMTEIPYENYLPEKVDFIFAGEIHDQPRVQKEVLAFIRAAMKKYPNRPVYVATEFALDADNDSTQIATVAQELMLLKSKEEMWEMLGYSFYGAPVFLPLLEEGVTVVGLEPQNYLLDKIELEAGLTPETFAQIHGLYGAYASSESGVALRNKIWAQHLLRLKQEHPDALIIIYCGAGHVAYQLKNSLTALLNEKLFVALFLTAGAQHTINPMFRRMRESKELRDAFYADENAKMVTYWKRPTNYKKLLGADLSVLLRK